MRTMYQGLEVKENHDDTAVDAAGYTGEIFRRVNQKQLEDISLGDFLANF